MLSTYLRVTTFFIVSRWSMASVLGFNYSVATFEHHNLTSHSTKVMTTFSVTAKDLLADSRADQLTDSLKEAPCTSLSIIDSK